MRRKELDPESAKRLTADLKKAAEDGRVFITYRPGQPKIERIEPAPQPAPKSGAHLEFEHYLAAVAVLWLLLALDGVVSIIPPLILLAAAGVISILRQKVKRDQQGKYWKYWNRF